MTSDANTLDALRPGPMAEAPAPHANFTDLVRRYLSLALHNDYLSSGRGHRHSRRVLRDRLVTTAKGGSVPTLLPGPADDALAADPERRYLSEVARRPRLTSREEYGLVGRMRQGDRGAYEALIGANLGLVVMTARRYQRPGIPLLDLIAEGNFGLMRAAERFDREIGCRFSTYANWWIRQAIQLAMPKLSSVVRRPLSHGRSTALRQVADAGDTLVPVDAISDVPPQELAAAEAEAPAVDLVETEHAAHASEPSADESHASPRGDMNVADMLDTLLIDPDEEPPAAALAKERLTALYGAMAQLPERDRIIVTGRYALDSDRPITLDELSQRLGVSVERVRQLEVAAVRKLGKLLIEAGESAESLL